MVDSCARGRRSGPTSSAVAAPGRDKRSEVQSRPRKRVRRHGRRRGSLTWEIRVTWVQSPSAVTALWRDEKSKVDRAAECTKVTIIPLITCRKLGWVEPRSWDFRLRCASTRRVGTPRDLAGSGSYWRGIARIFGQLRPKSCQGFKKGVSVQVIIYQVVAVKAELLAFADILWQI